MAERERPRGVTVVAVALGLVGLIGLVPALAAAAGLVGSGKLMFGFLIALFPQVLIAAAVGLWRLAPWGYHLAVGAVVLWGFLHSGALLFAPGGPYLDARLVPLVVPITLFLYLVRPSVRARFQPRRASA